MEYIGEYSGVANDFLNILTNYSQVICSYQYSKDNVSIGFIQESLDELKEKTGKDIDFVELQGIVQQSTEEEVPRNTMEASALVYLYIQELIENKMGKHDPHIIFIGMRLKKYNCDLLGQMCVLHNRMEFFEVISKLNNDDIEIFIVG